MRRMTLAQRCCASVLQTTPRPTSPVEINNLLRRLPRNRAEARRLIATRGHIARVG